MPKNRSRRGCRAFSTCLALICLLGTTLFASASEEKCTNLLLTSEQKKVYRKKLKHLRWHVWIDKEFHFRRLINKKDYDNKGKMHPTEIYGVKTYLDWKRADDFLASIPKRQLELSVELFSEVHRIANQSSYPFLQKISRVLPDGILPSKPGAWKIRDSIGKDPLFAALTEKQYQTIKNNPWLDGFIELPWPLSRPDRRRGVILYTRAKNVKQRLQDLIDWYNQNKETMDPVELAARFQQAFISIHPNIDGNGRTSRLLMDRILAEFDLPPPILETHVNDLYMEPHEYAQAIREGINTFLELTKEIPPTKKNDPDSWDPFNSTVKPPMIGSNGWSSTMKLGYGPRKEKIPQGMSKTWGTPELWLGQHHFMFMRDGFFYSPKGIPHVYHGGKLYPVADKTYNLYFENGPVRKGVERKLTEHHKEVYRNHFKLIRQIERKELDPYNIEVVPYKEIAEANENEHYHVYSWQKKVFADAVRIFDTDPVAVLVRNRFLQTGFEMTANGHDSPPKTGERISAADVIAQYEAVDFKFHEYLLYAKDFAVDQVPTIMQSRKKLHAAARELLKSFFTEMNSLSPEAKEALDNHAGTRVWKEYLKHSKLSYEDWGDAILAVNDDVIYLMRNDTSLPLRLGFRSQSDYRKLFDRLPASRKLRRLIREWQNYHQDPKNEAEIKAWLKNCQDCINDHEKLVSTLPASIQALVKDITATYKEYNNTIWLAVDAFFKSTFSDRGTSEEYQRAFVDFMLHASGHNGIKQGSSLTSSPYLLVPRIAAEPDSKVALAYTRDKTKNRLYIAEVPKEWVSWDFASHFSTEYEFISLKRIPARKIVKSFTQEELFQPTPENIPEDAKKFIDKHDIGIPVRDPNAKDPFDWDWGDQPAPGPGGTGKKMKKTLTPGA
ncbi:MAG: Fic family protein [Bdellovibrionota bacterium]